MSEMLSVKFLNWNGRKERMDRGMDWTGRKDRMYVLHRGLGSPWIM